MTPAHHIYLRECHKDMQAAMSRCSHCQPKPDKEQKRWEDSLYSVVTYLDGIAKPHGYPPATVGDLYSDILKCGEAVVMEGDSYDTGKRSWYWRFKFMDTPNWAPTSVDALISFVNAFEKKLGADPAAPSLVFVVRLSSRTCSQDDHDWKFLYTGRHGSDKGDDFYECRVCGMDKRE